MKGMVINMVLPSELKKVEFSKTIKGYSPSEVDEYISYLVSLYTEKAKECSELEKKYKNMQLKLEEAKSEENAISALILNAQKMADAIVKDANDKAKAITEAVNESCDHIINTFREKVVAERNKLAQTEKIALEFKESLYSAYREHIANIDKILPDETDEQKLSEATEEELVDSAFELAQRKYESSEESDIDLPPMYAESNSIEE